MLFTIDIGGTFIKYGLMDARLSIDPYRQDPNTTYD